MKNTFRIGKMNKSAVIGKVTEVKGSNVYIETAAGETYKFHKDETTACPTVWTKYDEETPIVKTFITGYDGVWTVEAVIAATEDTVEEYRELKSYKRLSSAVKFAKEVGTVYDGVIADMVEDDMLDSVPVKEYWTPGFQIVA